MNKCACGCGRDVKKTWARGHANVRVKAADGTLYCKDCGFRKPETEFYRSSKSRSGRMGHCKVHHDERLARSRARATSQTPEQRKRKQRDYTVRSMYGISLDEFEAMAEEQGGLCAICSVRPLRRLDIDHCHEAGHVRGLLCGPCNKALGMMRDSPDLLRKAASYLEDRAVPKPGQSLYVGRVHKRQLDKTS